MNIKFKDAYDSIHLFYQIFDIFLSLDLMNILMQLRRLHARGCMHGNLKNASSLKINKDGEIELGDFHKAKCTTVSGTGPLTPENIKPLSNKDANKDYCDLAEMLSTDEQVTLEGDKDDIDFMLLTMKDLEFTTKITWNCKF